MKTKNKYYPRTVLNLLVIYLVATKRKAIGYDELTEEKGFGGEKIGNVESTPTVEEIDDTEPKMELLQANVAYNKNSQAELQQLSFYTAFALHTENRSSLCYKEIQIIRFEYLSRKPWAMKVLDATGYRPPGFLFGHNYWLGSRDTCNSVQNPMTLTISDRYKRVMEYGILNETSPFDVQFKVAHLDFNSPWQVDWIFIPPEKTIIWGLCLPASCSNIEIKKTLEHFLKSESFIDRKILGINVTFVDIRDLEINDDEFFSLTSVRLMLTIFSFTFLMIVAAQCLRLRLNNVEKDNNESKKKNTPSLENSFFAFIQCFDAQMNLEKIFREIESGKGEIHEINAIRSINANIIVAVHVLFYGFFTCINRNYLMSKHGRATMGYTFIIVEAFFILSGFLQTYNFLRNQNKRQKVKESGLGGIVELFSKSLFHRWLRLAPLYYVVVCLNTVIHSLLYRISVYKLSYRDDLLIIDSWWRHLLFIQNFQRVETLAVNWSWSLACEMQFFLVGMTLLFIYAKYPELSKTLFIIIALGNVSAYFYNGEVTNFSWQFDVSYKSALELYFNPCVRITSYLIGMLAAWYVVEKPVSLNAQFESLIGYSAIIIFGIVMSPLYDDLATTPALTVFSTLLSRLMISVCICWVIVAAVKDRRTWLTPILQVRLFQPTARLSYAIYLLNPIILTTLAGLTNSGIRFDWTMIFIWMAGTIFLTKWIAVIFSIAFELPYCNISSLLLKPTTTKL